MPTPKQLIANLQTAEKAVEDAREAIIREIRSRLGDMTPYQFSVASGINKGNLYSLLSNGKWNKKVACAALELLTTPIENLQVARLAARATDKALANRTAPNANRRD